MSEKTLEWNLGFARDEVVAGVEKLLTQSESVHCRTDTEAETRFHAAFSQGMLDIAVRPLTSYRSPFNIQATLPRTLLIVCSTGLTSAEEATLRYRLTLAFLRVGG